MLIEFETIDGPRKVNVCNYCKCVCIPPGQRFCSGRCARNYHEFREEKPVFTNCNVCGIVLREPGEFQMGMCERCAGE